MKVRILTERHPHHSQPDREYIASGTEIDLPVQHAKELLQRGDAEPIAQKRVAKAERRVVKPETR